MDVYQNLEKLGLKLPPPPPRGGLYTPCRRFGESLYYISGCGPAIGSHNYIGKLGGGISLEEGQKAARDSMLNVLSVLQAEIGDLNRVKQAVKILTFVSSTPDFLEQPLVANGGSELLKELFGEEAGIPARSAIGVSVLPGNIAVETEAIFEVK